MPTVTLNKTIQTPLAALQTLATTTNSAGTGRLVSSVIDVATKSEGLVTCHIGRTATTAFTANMGVDVFLQLSAKSTGDDAWFDWYQFSTGTAAAGTCTDALTASVNGAGVGASSALTLASNADLDYSINKELLYFRNGTVANGEFHRCVWAGTASTAMWIAENLARDQSGNNIYNGNLEFKCAIDFSSITRMRALVVNNSGVAVDIELFLTTLDSATSA